MKSLLLGILLLVSGITHAVTLSAGSKNIGIKFSQASIGLEDYTVAGVSGRYFVADNFAVGTAYEYWFSGEPSISKLSVESTYFLPIDKTIKPYIGILGGRYFIEDYSNINSYGYRLGIAYLKDNLIISLGYKQEDYDTDVGFFTESDKTTEFLIGYAF